MISRHLSLETRLDLLQTTHGHSAAQVLHHVAEEARRQIGRQFFPDDFTLLAVRRLPVSG
jgi:serine phosphatase RsbU (regulator of sigma subunit)